MRWSPNSVTGSIAAIALASIVLFFSASSTRADLTLSGNSAAPTPGSNWIYSDTGDYYDGELNGSRDYTNNSPPPGQSFTTTSTIGLQLNAFSFIRANSAPPTDYGYGGDTTSLTINIGVLTDATSSSATFTSLYSGTATFDPSVVNDNKYLTFSGFSPIQLDPNTTYGFVISESDGSYIGWAKHYSSDAGGDAYPGGQAFNLLAYGDGGAVFADGEQYADHGFYADISEITPEPSSVGMLGFGFGTLLLRRRSGVRAK